MNKPTVVAEIGGNHGGDFRYALHAVKIAKEAGADYIKFQKRDVDGLPDHIKSKPRMDVHAFGRTEYEHRKALEFDEDQHSDLKAACAAVGIGYSCSAWDQKSLDFLKELNCDYIKIPSARNQDCLKWDLGVSDAYHISMGMLTGSERDSILRVITKDQRRWIPYACTSKYPCEMNETYLLELPYLQYRCGTVGFSGHHNGIAVDLAAAMLGATWIERHFTLDRNAKGTDQFSSLAPEGMSKLNRDLTAIAAAYRPKPGGLPECEIEPRKKLKGI